MELILGVVQVVLSVVLIFLVLMHSGKDAGLSGAFGVGTGAGPARRRVAGRAQPEPLDDRGRAALLFIGNDRRLLKTDRPPGGGPSDDASRP